MDQSQILIEFDRVWKKFKRGDQIDSLRDLLPRAAATLFRRNQRGELDEGEFWALEDVSFRVRRGEALGIIGPNGAGKSTILKLLSRILKPTRGGCAVRGRVGALIEVAAGFHPDLTGRENIYLQGTIMGMRRSEIARKLDEIIEFAGVREFIDTPVKRYSSGMHARLGFSIAAHLDPDVLLIDEVLSVGDMAFQQRCVERMEQFKRQGVAITFVSHNLQAVANLCDRGLYLQGRVLAQGPVREVLENYVRAAGEARGATGEGTVEICAAQLIDEQGLSVTAVRPGVPLRIRVTYLARKATTDLTFGFLVHRSTDGLLVYDGNVRGTEIGIDALTPGDRVVADFTFRAHLTRGQYHLECHVFHNPSHRFLSRFCPAAILTVHETRTHGGVADLELDCRMVERTHQDQALLAAGGEPVPQQASPRARLCP